MHFQVRIGADHGKAALAHRRQDIAILFGDFGEVVDQAGAERDLGLRDAGARHVQAFEHRRVALGADIIERQRAGLPRARRQILTRCAARRHDRIIAILGHAHDAELVLHRRRGAGGIGQKHHRAALGAKTGQRAGGGREWRMTIMDHTPDVTNQGVVILGKFGQAGDKSGLHGQADRMPQPRRQQ